MRTSKGRLALSIVLSLVMAVGLFETPFVASRVAPKAFWDTYCHRARKKVVSAEKDLKKFESKIEKLKESLGGDSRDDEELAKLEASKCLILEHKKMMEEMMRQIESERDKALGQVQARRDAAPGGSAPSAEIN